MAFSEVPIQFPDYPLEFPIKDYPRSSDPAFIGIFYSRCKIGQLSGNEELEYAKRRPGVYFRSINLVTLQADLEKYPYYPYFVCRYLLTKYLLKITYARYCRLERDLYSRKDQLGVEIRERTKWDIREAMVSFDYLEIAAMNLLKLAPSLQIRF